MFIYMDGWRAGASGQAIKPPMKKEENEIYDRGHKEGRSARGAAMRSIADEFGALINVLRAA